MARLRRWPIIVAAAAAIGVAWAVLTRWNQDVAPVTTAPPPLPEFLADPAPLVRSAAGSSGPPAFREIPPHRSGIHFQYYNDEQQERLFGAETNGAGIGWIDADGNGSPDLYVPNGCRLPYRSGDRDYQDALFLNRADGSFFDASGLAGIDDNGFGHGVAAGDFDNDGWPDLYICNFGQNTLYRNSGDGTFRRVPSDPSIVQSAWHSGAAFGDLDRDGDLDLYVSVYAAADLDNVPVCYDSATGKHRVYCGPDRFDATQHFYFENSGDGSFRDATLSSGCDRSNGKGMGVLVADLDQDRWPEIFVANDVSPSFLYHMRPASAAEPARFEEIGVAAGVAFDGNGQLAAGMGIACGDADGDGQLDLYVSHYHREGNTFYKNQGHLSFADRTAAMRLYIPSLPYLGFGCEFFDYDNDGWVDLYVVNGHVLGPHYPERQMNPQLYQNRSGKSFQEVTSSAGDYFQGTYLARGSATADYDNDGAMDLAVSHLDRPVALLKNIASPRGNAIGIKCVGRQSCRDAVNTRIVAQLDHRSIARQILNGGSYQSAPDGRTLIGTGTNDRVDRLQVHWQSGSDQVFDQVPCDGRYVVLEGGPLWRLQPWPDAASDARTP